jgi:ribosomal protein S18 acetylase RimI-like enzyme
MIELARRQLPGCSLLRVGTQAANPQAMRFYEGLGFRLSACHYVFHHHRPGGR